MPRPLFISSICCGLLSVFYCILATPVAQAHQLDVSYMDFGKNDAGALTLTVAVHPDEAFELVRAGSAAQFDLNKLQVNGDLISAYVQDHVEISRGGVPCVWNAGSAHTPPTDIEALGDGVTVAGVLDCASSSMSIEARSTLFLEGSPQQTTILRVELPDGYAERTTLSRDNMSGAIDVSEVFRSNPTSAPGARMEDGDDTASTGASTLLTVAGILAALCVIGLGYWKWHGKPKPRVDRP